MSTELREKKKSTGWRGFVAWCVGYLIGSTAVELLAVWLTEYDLGDWTWQRWVIYGMQFFVGLKLGRVLEREVAARHERKRK